MTCNWSATSHSTSNQNFSYFPICIPANNMSVRYSSKQFYVFLQVCLFVCFFSSVQRLEMLRLCFFSHLLLSYMLPHFVVFSFVLFTIAMILFFGNTAVSHNLFWFCSIVWQTLIGFYTLISWVCNRIFSVVDPHYTWCQIPQDSTDCTFDFTDWSRL